MFPGPLNGDNTFQEGRAKDSHVLMEEKVLEEGVKVEPERPEKDIVDE